MKININNKVQKSIVEFLLKDLEIKFNDKKLI